MISTYPLVHISGYAKLLGKLLRSDITLHCNKHCVFVDNIKDVQIRRKTVFVLFDWQNLVRQYSARAKSNLIDSTFDSVNPLYIVTNIVKGEESQIVQMLDPQKIRGLFYVDDDIETFRKGFTAILKDEIWIPRNILMTWVHQPGKQQASRYQEVLSAREAVVLQLIIDGRSNKEISHELYISANTVKAHLYNIYKKIGVSNRLQAAIWMANQGHKKNGANSLSDLNIAENANSTIAGETDKAPARGEQVLSRLFP